MRPDYDPEARAAEEAPRKRTVRRGRRRRRPASFRLPPDGKDSELLDLFEGLRRAKTIAKVRDRGVFNGCAIVTFMSRPVRKSTREFCYVDGVGRLKFNVHTQVRRRRARAERVGPRARGRAVTVARSVRTGKQAEHDDGGGGAVFYQLTTALSTDVPEAHLDFKKRKIMYPKDHDR